MWRIDTPPAQSQLAILRTSRLQVPYRKRPKTARRPAPKAPAPSSLCAMAAELLVAAVALAVVLEAEPVVELAVLAAVLEELVVAAAV